MEGIRATLIKWQQREAWSIDSVGAVLFACSRWPRASFAGLPAALSASRAPAGRTYPASRPRARYRFANPSATKLRLAFLSKPR